jgi:pimeloyl-ACP methyl ester carboxylesterase
MVLGLNATASVVEKFVTSSDGVEIFAQAVGDSRLPTLIFIHGLALSALVWVKILQDANLLKSFQLVGYFVDPLVMYVNRSTLGRIRFAWAWPKRQT